MWFYISMRLIDAVKKKLKGKQEKSCYIVRVRRERQSQHANIVVQSRKGIEAVSKELDRAEFTLPRTLEFLKT